MRVSSSTIFDSNVAALNQQQARLQQTQQQIASGRRLLTAATDPVAATRAMDISQADAMNTQQTSNRGAARDPLMLADSALASVTTLLQDVRTTAVLAGNGSLSSSNRATLAKDLTGRLQELVGLANSTDGSGNYLFSGFQAKTPPFVDTPAGVGYFGDDGQRLVQVSPGRQIAAGDSGADVFMRIKNGNGTFATQAAAANTGGGLVSVGAVANPALLTGNSYNLGFSVTAGVTTYSVTNTTTGLPVAGMTAQPYVSGQAIAFDGMQFDIKGAPANGDNFSVTHSINQSVFKTVADMIGALNTPMVGANMNNGLIAGINNLDNALDNVLNFRSSIGSRINELDSLQATGDSMGLQLKQSLSTLQDTDYSKAISDLNLQQTTLQAAQKTFAQVANLSMFTYL